MNQVGTVSWREGFDNVVNSSSIIIVREAGKLKIENGKPKFGKTLNSFRKDTSDLKRLNIVFHHGNRWGDHESPVSGGLAR